MTDPFIEEIVSVFTIGYAAADALGIARLDAQRAVLIQRLHAVGPLEGRTEAEWRAFYEGECVRMEMIRIGAEAK